MILIESIIKEAIEKDASDIHLINGMKPILRIARTLVEMKDRKPLDEMSIEMKNIPKKEEWILHLFMKIFV